MYLLDSDSVSYFQRGSKPLLEAKILSTPADQIWISVITVQEMIQGAFRVIDRPGSEDSGCRLLRDIMGDLAKFQTALYDAKAKRVFNDFSAAVKRVGKADCQIAAIALSRGFTVVTSNRQHFEQIPGVRLEDWTR